MILPPNTQPGDVLQLAYSDPRVPQQTYPGWALRYVVIGLAAGPKTGHFREDLILESAGPKGLVVNSYSLGELIKTVPVGDFVAEHWQNDQPLCRRLMRYIAEWPDSLHSELAESAKEWCQNNKE